jgi:hypothetical protein
VSTPSDGSGGGPVEEPVAQSGRPPVPPPAPSDAPADDAARDPAPVHQTDPVAFPLPPVAPTGEPATPPRQPAPDETGVLDLRAYPPRVPGRPARPPAEDGGDGAERGR